MLIKITDQITVTAVRSELLRPGEIVEIRDDLALSLLSSHPRAFARHEPKGFAVADVDAEFLEVRTFAPSEMAVLAEPRRKAPAKKKGS